MVADSRVQPRHDPVCHDPLVQRRGQELRVGEALDAVQLKAHGTGVPRHLVVHGRRNAVTAPDEDAERQEPAAVLRSSSLGNQTSSASVLARSCRDSMKKAPTVAASEANTTME